VALQCSSMRKISDLYPSKQDTTTRTYAAHNFATLSALCDHIASARAYFAAGDSPRSVLCTIYVRIVQVIMLNISSRGKAGSFVVATQRECLQHGAILKQVCAKLATCS